MLGYVVPAVNQATLRERAQYLRPLQVDAAIESQIVQTTLYENRRQPRTEYMRAGRAFRVERRDRASRMATRRPQAAPAADFKLSRDPRFENRHARCRRLVSQPARTRAGAQLRREGPNPIARLLATCSADGRRVAPTREPTTTNATPCFMLFAALRYPRRQGHFNEPGPSHLPGVAHVPALD